MTIALIIPALNEEQNLQILLKTINTSYFDEIILVDGKSTDQTISVAKTYIPSIKIIIQKGTGKGAAMIEGAHAAYSKFLIFMDADGSMNPDEVRLILDKYEEGFEFVKGTRNNYGGRSHDITAFRDFGNNLFTFLTNVLYRTNYSDQCYGYFGITKASFQRMKVSEKKFGIEAEVAIKSALLKIRTTEFPTIERKRIYGASNLHSFKDGMDILKVILKLFTRKIFNKL